MSFRNDSNYDGNEYGKKYESEKYFRRNSPNREKYYRQRSPSVEKYYRQRSASAEKYYQQKSTNAEKYYRQGSPSCEKYYKHKSPSRSSKHSGHSYGRSHSREYRKPYPQQYVDDRNGGVYRRSRSRSRGQYKQYERKRDYGHSVYAKDTDEIQAKLNDDEKDARTINVWQLSQRVKKRDLEDFFGRVGKLCVVKLITDPRNGRSRGVAYIQFRDVESVDSSLSLNGQRLMGVPIQIRTVSSEKCRAAESSTTVMGINLRAMTKLCVTNLNPRITEENLNILFSPFGELREVKMMRNIDGSSSGTAFITFVRGENAKAALDQLNGYEIGNYNIRITPVSENSTFSELSEDSLSLKKSDRIDLMAKLSVGTGLQMTSSSAAQISAQETQPIITTPCFMLSNMFDVREAETNTDFREEIFEDVLEECNKFGGVLHIHVDKKAASGVVYVKCPSVPIARQCAESLNGRSFDTRLIKADYVPLSSYSQKFPDSVHMSKLITKV